MSLWHFLLFKKSEYSIKYSYICKANHAKRNTTKNIKYDKVF